ncbi:unnamed protein product [Lasius platythorax]|uniref:Uncharacterized protein n=1 Tax=Lasius platythorax TaxID=488582 RepID=A0AAV2N5C2_9HYME
MRGKISVLETYRDVRYAYKILERDKNARGTDNLVGREVDETNTVGRVTLYFARLFAFSLILAWPMLLQIQNTVYKRSLIQMKQSQMKQVPTTDQIVHILRIA